MNVRLLIVIGLLFSKVYASKKPTGIPKKMDPEIIAKMRAKEERIRKEEERIRKEEERQLAFARQTPSQKEELANFLEDWKEYILEEHPHYQNYLHENQKEIQENFINQRALTYQIIKEATEDKDMAHVKALRRQAKALEYKNTEIRKREEERLIGAPLSLEEEYVF